jgi:hypothetical protein
VAEIILVLNGGGVFDVGFLIGGWVLMFFGWWFWYWCWLLWLFLWVNGVGKGGCGGG